MQSFRPIHFSVFKIQIFKNGFVGPKSFRGFLENRPLAPFGGNSCPCSESFSPGSSGYLPHKNQHLYGNGERIATSRIVFYLFYSFYYYTVKFRL